MARAGALVACALAVGFLALALGGALLSASTGAEQALALRVRAELPASGVRHPVTAVLLNFRAYDTLLEIAVLAAAWTAARALARETRRPVAAPAAVLTAVFRLLAPAIAVFAAYLLWRGEHAPGGAFHAGAMLAAAAVLASLAGARLPLGRFEPAFVSAGLAVFLAVGIATLAARGAFLAYPPEWAGALIFAIEAAATVSIALALALLFDREFLR
jgi:multisubunit Na+/H+ antiporter MnhB subunit